MQGKLLKFIIFICILCIIISCFSNKTFATWTDDARIFLESADDSANINNDQLKDASDSIYNMLSSIGMIVSVVVGISLGVIYMMTSADNKAKVKESLVPYLIGCIVTFGAFGIWKIMINTFGKI